ncbi:hypothetical protein ACVWW4_008272 [Bradyrhizobium sp. LB7.1]
MSGSCSPIQTTWPGFARQLEASLMAILATRRPSTYAPAATTPSADTGSERDAGSDGTFMALIPGESIGRTAGYGLCTTLAGKASTGKIPVKWLCLLPIWPPCQPHSNPRSEPPP